ncbi:MAG: sigma-70 family RNA polymerase sigma factor, partial [Verrucomicrobia bacterium]|nr:sigma-70 family RNA polymerase sigma factor [Verrucomicrobiota bacterium]
MLRGHLHNAFPSLPDVDDIVQESYFRLIQAKKAGPIRYVKAFLFATARNVAIDLLRRKRIVPIENVTEVDRLAVIGEEAGVADAVGRQEELAFLADAIRALPERCRKVLTLRKLYGLSQ